MRHLASSCQLYAITPPTWQSGFEKTIKQALEAAPVAALQLRLKNTKDDVIKKVASLIQPICDINDTHFILNDNPKLAKEIGADGVHIGQQDMPLQEARIIMGEDKLIGVSCYDSKHYAFEAGEKGADYVAFGAFYSTQTKPNAPTPSLDLLRFWADYTNVPVVAIGGIAPENALPLVQSGADYVAAITSIWQHPKGTAAAVKEFHKTFDAAS